MGQYRGLGGQPQTHHSQVKRLLFCRTLRQTVRQRRAPSASRKSTNVSHQVNLAAWIRQTGSREAQQCRVIDISQNGVRLELADPCSVPDAFLLSLSKNEPGQHASVRWRLGTQLGAGRVGSPPWLNPPFRHCSCNLQAWFALFALKPRRNNNANSRENRCHVGRCWHNCSQQRGSSRSLVRLSPPSPSLWVLSPASLRLLSSPAFVRLSSLLSSPSLPSPLVLACRTKSEKNEFEPRNTEINGRQSDVCIERGRA